MRPKIEPNVFDQDPFLEDVRPPQYIFKRHYLQHGIQPWESTALKEVNKNLKNKQSPSLIRNTASSLRTKKEDRKKKTADIQEQLKLSNNLIQFHIKEPQRGRRLIKKESIEMEPFTPGKTPKRDSTFNKINESFVKPLTEQAQSCSKNPKVQFLQRKLKFKSLIQTSRGCFSQRKRNTSNRQQTQEYGLRLSLNSTNIGSKTRSSHQEGAPKETIDVFREKSHVNACIMMFLLFVS